MNFIKSLPFHLFCIVLINCLFLSEIVKCDTSSSSDNDIYPVNNYPLNSYPVVNGYLTVLDENNLDNPNRYDFLNALNSYENLAKKLEQQQRRLRMARALNKRNCLINAGMAQNCDFKELVSAVNARKFFESAHGPGKRRKRSFLTKIN